jgi:3D (Asp-Asp-Asp) domain-containing protein/murein DD-endopeptidase MepM/ murein hydrolase activator NlpD
MKFVQTSDYLIYFDDARVDQYILSWNTTLGLSAGEASGSVTMFKSKSLMDWKAYLTQVRVFMKNVFSGKYAMVFEGEITSRSWNDQRSDSGVISYQVQGFFHWLDVPIPLMVNTSEALDALQTFEYEAQGINSKAVASLFKNQEEISLRNKTIAEIIDYLFEKMNQGYYTSAQNDSTFAWSALKERFKVMVDINKNYRSGGFLDIFTLINSTQVQTFYVYLNEILNQMMFEFYQDRDGAFRIKNPSWKDDILKNHIIDESLVARISGLDNWVQEPTRVLAIGGTTDLYTQSTASGADLTYLKVDSVPVGLYIGDAQPSHVKDERYYTAAYDQVRQKTGLNAGDLSKLGGVQTDQWFDNIAGNYAVTSPFTGDAPRQDVKGLSTAHHGTDYAVPNGTTLRNLGTSGKVISAAMDHTSDIKQSGGNILVIEEVIGGATYHFKYMHLSSFAVSPRDAVSVGQVIGTSGGKPGAYGAGGSTNPHLHVGIFDMSSGSEKAIDPDAFLNKMKDIVRNQQAQSNITPIPAENIENDQIMRDISGISDLITKLAQAIGDVDVDVAKIYVAVNYHYSKDDLVKKQTTYQNEAFLNDLLSNLSTVTLDFMWKQSSMFSYLGAVEANKIAQLAQKKINEKQATPTSGSQEPAFNAFAATDKTNSYASTFFPTFSETLSTLNGGNLSKATTNTSQSVVTAATAWRDFEATAYIATCPGCTGITFSGKDVTDTSKDYFIIAVDPNVIPIYSYVEIEGPKGVSGTYQALDTGGDIKGNRIDILMSTYGKAIAFGREQIKVRIVSSGKNDTSAPVLRPVTYSATNQIVYPIPPQGEDYRTYIQTNPGHVDPNLICAIIDALSSWKPSFQAKDRNDVLVSSGLMGLPSAYTTPIPNVDWLDGNRSIEFGSNFFAYCMSLLNNKVTVSLAAYFIGDPTAISNIATTTTKALDYLKMKSEIAKLNTSVTGFVDHVIQIYLDTMHGDYLPGDPHKSFGTANYGATYDRVSTFNSGIDEFSNKQLIQLSEEERRFKMQLNIVEQRLIRYDSNVMAGNSSLALANEFILKFAKYTMQLNRASTHSINIESVIGMPLLRPGFNTWIEPSRANLVAYITGVTHQGSFLQGCFTSVRAEFVRTPATYKDVDDSIFIGDHYADSSYFGPVVDVGTMDTLRQTLIELNNNSDEVVDDAFNIHVLQDLYNSPADDTTSQLYITEWNAEYTKEEVESKINTKYSVAPPIVQKRTAELKAILTASEDFFINKLMMTLN